MASRGRHRPNHPERQRRAHQVREKPPSHHGKGRLSSGRHIQLTTTRDNRCTHRREREGMHDDVLLLLAYMYYIHVCVMFCVHAGSEQRTGLSQENRRGEAVEWSVWAYAGELHVRVPCVHCRGGHCWKQVERGGGREGGRERERCEGRDFTCSFAQAVPCDSGHGSHCVTDPLNHEQTEASRRGHLSAAQQTQPAHRGLPQC